MKLTFFGAARSVTGSCHCVDINGKRILIDCGLQQGRDERDNSLFDFVPASIDYVIVTHAHIDHSGRVPLLKKRGYQGKFYTTRLTGELLSIMLRDSAHIQESEAMWQNQKGRRSGKPVVEPLYTIADADAALQNLSTYEYKEKIELTEGVTIRFNDAGHILGSSNVEMWLTENGITKKIVFSGDIGNVKQPIIRDPQPIEDGADYVVMESTYGDRNHKAGVDFPHDLAAIFDKTFARGGSVIIPSFAVGRTQELLYFIREMKEQQLVKSLPDFPVYVDSPLARAATQIYSGDLRGYLDKEALEEVRGGEKLFTFPNLRLTEDVEESKALNLDKSPKVIISASGMCDAGRIRHHLKHNLWCQECSVVFVGHQAVGSLGRRLLDGADKVKLLGEEIVVKAELINFNGLSSHADRDHLLKWAQQFTPAPQHIFVIHGEGEVTQIFADSLIERGIPAHAPQHMEVYDLAAGKLQSSGEPLSAKAQVRMVSAAYRQLQTASQQLADVIKNLEGRPNKDLYRFADQLKALINKFKN